MTDAKHHGEAARVLLHRMLTTRHGRSYRRSPSLAGWLKLRIGKINRAALGYLLVVRVVPENAGCKKVSSLATVGALILRIRRNVMTRWIVALACVLAIAVIAFATGADARGYTRKRCIAPEKAQSWVC